MAIPLWDIKMHNGRDTSASKIPIIQILVHLDVHSIPIPSYSAIFPLHPETPTVCAHTAQHNTDSIDNLIKSRHCVLIPFGFGIIPPLQPHLRYYVYLYLSECDTHMDRPWNIHSFPVHSLHIPPCPQWWWWWLLLQLPTLPSNHPPTHTRPTQFKRKMYNYMRQKSNVTASNGFNGPASRPSSIHSPAHTEP